MKITFLLPGPDWGGGIRVVATYAQWLIQHGHEVIVFYRHEKIALRGVLSSALSRILSPARWQPSRSHLDLLDIPQIPLPEDRSVSDSALPNADIVIATYWKTAREVLALSPEKGAKAYFIQHYEAVFEGADKVLVNETWTYPMRKIVVAPWLEEIARRDFGDSSAIVVPNGVNTQQFTAPPRQKGTRPTVGFIFSHPVFKGSDIAIKAFVRLREQIPHLRLVAFGTSWRRCLKDRTCLPKWAEYQILPPQNRIRELYAQCDVWVSASRCEGFGLPLLEAMACRTPVVATPTGIAPELAEQGGLCITPHEDPEGLACNVRRILDLSGDDWAALSRQAYDTAQSFDVEQSARQFEKALQTIVSGPS